MVDPLDEDGPRRRVQEREQPVVSDAKLAVVGGDQSNEVAPRLAGGRLELPNDPTSDRRVDPAEVAGGGLGPADRPGLQRFNLRFNSSWLTVRPDRMSSRALSRPTRKAAR